jgi:hypothetical protein
LDPPMIDPAAVLVVALSGRVIEISLAPKIS